MKKYFPILLSKAGELTALSHLQQNVKDEISPIIEILPDSIERVSANLIRHWTFDDNQILIDFSLFEPFDRTLVRDFVTALFDNSVNAVPVIQENSDPRYINLVSQFVARNQCKVCIRISYTSGGFDNYNARIEALMEQVNSTRANTILLIDLEYAENNNHNFLAALARDTVSHIPNSNQWAAIVVAAGSFPNNLSLLNPGQVYNLQRYEWNIWSTLQAIPALKGVIKYGDYGTKYPFYSEVNFPGSCSIKYTAENNFVIYRGEIAANHPNGNGQFITFGAQLIRTPIYLGAAFSWGDSQIDRIAHENMADPRKKPGSLTTWVEISQNHHITLLHSLL